MSIPLVCVATTDHRKVGVDEPRAHVAAVVAVALVHEEHTHRLDQRIERVYGRVLLQIVPDRIHRALQCSTVAARDYALRTQLSLSLLSLG